MSAYQFEEFERRMRRINRRHTKLSHGFVTEVTDDGLVVARPSRRSTGTLVRTVALILLVVMIFKAILHAQLGAAAYDMRVDRLSEGTVVERAGAWAMTADPATRQLSTLFASLVR